MNPKTLLSIALIAGALIGIVAAISGWHTRRASAAPPASLYVTLDCPVGGAITGTADNCTVPLANTANILVGVTLHNNSGVSVTMRGFTLDVVQDSGNPSLLSLGAGPGPDVNKDANPDATQSNYPTFGCASPPPSATNGTPAGGSTAELICFSGAADGPTIPNGGSLKLADVIYTDNGTTDGVVNLSFANVALLDNGVAEIGSCNPALGVPIPCFGTTIAFGVGTTFTPGTSTPTFTNTPTPTLTATATPITSGTPPPIDATADRVAGQAGSFVTGSCNQGGISASGLCNPRGAVVDGAGNLYVADFGNNRVLEYNTPLTGDFIADRVFGQAGFTTNATNFGGLSASSLNLPTGLALDAAGNLFVADSGNHRVLEFDTPLTSDTVADRVFGQGGIFTSGVSNLGGSVTASTLSFPEGVAVDGSKHLYISDSNNNRVLEFDDPLMTDPGAEFVFGQSGSFITGACDAGTFTVDASTLCQPYGVAVDSAGNVYVADQLNYRVLEYNVPLTTDANADRVFGHSSLTGYGCNIGGVSASTMCDPFGVAVDSGGNLFVADVNNHRVLEYNAPNITLDSTADLVFGQGGSFIANACNSGGVLATSLCQPWAPALDPSGNLFIADQFNNRVLEFDRLSGPPIDMTGTWSTTVLYTVPAGTPPRSCVSVLLQTGTVISGTLDCAGLGVAVVGGNLAGGGLVGLTGTFASVPGLTANFSGTTNGNKAAGTWSDSFGDSGTWTSAKRPVISGLALTADETNIPAGAVAVPIKDIPIEAIPLAGALPISSLNNIQLSASPLRGIPLRGIPLRGIATAPNSLLGLIPLSEIPITRPGGWDAILTPPLKGQPLSTVLLKDIYALNPPPPALDPSLPDGNPALLTIGELDLSQTPLRGINMISIAMGALPLRGIPITQANLYSDWCAALANIGSSCAAAGLPGDGSLDSTTLLDLDLRGVPLRGIPLRGIPLRGISTEGIDIGTTPLRGIPLRGIPLRGIPLRGIPLSSTNPVASPLRGIPLRGIDVLGTPLRGIPLRGIVLTSSPLRGIPLRGIGPGVVDCTMTGVDCSGASVQTLADALALNAILATATLGDVIALAGNFTLGDLQFYGSVNLQDTLAAIPLRGILLKDTPLDSVALQGTPLRGIPLRGIAATSAPLRGIPLRGISGGVDCVVMNCTATSTQTLGDAANHVPNAILANATLGDLGFYGDVSVQDLIAPPATASDVSFFLSFFYGDLTLGDLNTPALNLGSLTLGQLLLALLIQSDYPWEDLPLDQMGVQDFAGTGGTLHYRLAFVQTGGGPATNPLISVQLPAGFRYVRGSSSIDVVNLTPPIGFAILLPDPVVNGSQLTFASLGTGSFRPGDTAHIHFEARPGLRLGSFLSSASLTAVGATFSANNQAPVKVTENLEPNETEGAAAAIDKDILYISHISSSTDKDFFKFPVPPVGSRLSVLLSHQTTDGDVILYRPTNISQDLRPTGGIPLQSPPLDDAPPDVKPQAAPPPETLQDISVSGSPLRGISANRGTGDETIGAIALSGDAGSYAIQVSGYNGASSPDPYVLRVKVTPPPPTPACAPRVFQNAGAGIAGALPVTIPPSVTTLFLVDQKRLGDIYGLAAAQNVMTALNNIANRNDLGVTPASATAPRTGQVLTVEGNGPVQTAYNDWDTQNPCDPAKANAIVKAINGVVDGYRPNLPNLKYLVVVGSDEVIPFTRIPDLTRIANETEYAEDLKTIGEPNSNALFGSFVTGNIMSDDPLASFKPIPFLDRQLYTPSVAIGRLVETPSQIVGQINQFTDPLTNGRLDPHTALTTGYDFLTDGGMRIAGSLDTEVGTSSSTRLLDPPLNWTNIDLISQFMGHVGPPDIVSINAHFDHFEALPAASFKAVPPAPRPVVTTADVQAGQPMPKRIIFSMGCHAGTNIADSAYGPAADPVQLLDWAQAYAGRGAAVYVANTGYGLGDTVLVAYSEELMANFAARLNGSLTVGQALQYAKQDYLGSRVQFETYDEKVLAEATFYGLPMFKLGAATGPPPPPPPPPPATTTSTVDPVTGADAVAVAFSPQFNATTIATGKYYTIPGGAIEATSGRPVQPVIKIDLPAGPGGQVAHGVVLTALTSVDESGFDAAFSQLAFDSTTPERPSDVVFPTSIQNLTTFDTPAGQRQRLNLMPAQFIPNPLGTTPGVGTERRDTSGTALVLYGPPTADFTPPVILQTRAAIVGTQIGFTLDATDNLATGADTNISDVSILYRQGTDSIWKTVHLASVSGTNTYTGGAPLGAGASSIEYIAFVVDKQRNVATTTNKGDLHHAATPPPPPTGFTLTVDGTPALAGWFRTAAVIVTGDPAVQYNISIDGHASAPVTGPVPVTGDGVHFVDVSGSDGVSHGSAIVAVDNHGPVITIDAPSGSYSLNQIVPASYRCTDPGSGTASCTGTVANGANFDTSLGTHTFIVNATDIAGNSSQRTVIYNTGYRFTGFFQPVDAVPTLNLAKAGSSIPLKWNLRDASGAYIRSLGAVTSVESQRIACASSAPLDAVETTLAAGSSGLQYDLTNEQYIYAWKTLKTWVGTCRRLTLTLNDGTTHIADFKFN